MLENHTNSLAVLRSIQWVGDLPTNARGSWGDRAKAISLADVIGTAIVGKLTDKDATVFGGLVPAKDIPAAITTVVVNGVEYTTMALLTADVLGIEYDPTKPLFSIPAPALKDIRAISDDIAQKAAQREKEESARIAQEQADTIAALQARVLELETTPVSVSADEKPEAPTATTGTPAKAVTPAKPKGTSAK